MTTRVHCQRMKYDVYIGRGRCPRTGNYSIWGNPFSCVLHSSAPYLVETHEDSLIKHKEWIRSQPELMLVLCSLKDKILGCWCELHERCHGDNLIDLIKELCYAKTLDDKK
jgi:hypothetical protein